ncbi:META domain-containing protein [Candidatus Electronema sp. TJ]|uniref:META domain-containing protein n=1 Tax=Candidatus Electronema sp. TJ TaxID=3401573 RepID=UPI003AA8418D
MPWSLLATLALSAVLALSGCSSKKDETAPPIKPPPAAEAESSSVLHGTSWQLVSLRGQSPKSGAAAMTLHFTGGKISGSAGCNTYSGPHAEKGKEKIRIGQLATTNRKCSSPERMEQERLFMEMLRAAESFTLEEGRLTLKDADGRSAAVFKPQSQELKGTIWRVVSYSNGQGGLSEVLSKGRSMTAVFSVDGQLSGSAGCNSYKAVFTGSPESKSFSFDMIEVGAKQCPSPDIMEQEGGFMAALYASASYLLDDRALTLNDADGKPTVIFSRL